MTLTTVNPALLDTQAQYTGFKNRIINGAMVIDQRNAGASVSVTGFNFAVDRFTSVRANGATQTITSQRSTVAPAGFVNSLLYSVTTGGAVAAGDICYIGQSIEGFNIADFGWGTANAIPITLSFKARASITGTFGVLLRGSTGGVAATYTISAANTFEDKTITFAAQTSGTWSTDNSSGIGVLWDMGVGTTFSAAAGGYTAGNFYGVTGVTKLAATSGATFYITGVQLEKGSTATAFDYRPYGTELALCQRYLPALISSGTTDFIGNAQAASTTAVYPIIQHPVTPRVAPTGLTASAGTILTVNGGNASSSIVLANGGIYASRIVFNTTGVTGNVFYGVYLNTTGATLLFTGCEL
jgi:hypothetical protein